MTLEEALLVVDHMRDSYERSIVAAALGAEHSRRAEALALVLTKARENLAAETVAKVNALSARALEMAMREEAERRKPGVCVWCGKELPSNGNDCGNGDCGSGT